VSPLSKAIFRVVRWEFLLGLPVEDPDRISYYLRAERLANMLDRRYAGYVNGIRVRLMMILDGAL